MAINSDPSIYTDRSTIGSSDELDEYGVWVKSEPQDFTPEVKTSAPVAEPSLPDIEDLPDLELEADDLSMESFVSDIPSFSSDTKRITETEIHFESLQSEPAEKIEQTATKVDSDDFAELSMDDFLEDTTFSEVSLGDNEKTENLEEDDNLDIDLTFQDNHEHDIESSDANDFDFSIVDETEEEKISGEEAPMETVSDFDDFLNELSDSDTPTTENVSTAKVAIQEEPSFSPSAVDDFADIELEVEESEPVENTFSTISNADTSSFDLNVNIEEENAEIALEPPARPAEEAVFDDVDALSKDLLDTEASIQSYTENQKKAENNLSTQLLMKIADELSSIKGELFSLKTELSELRSETRTEPPKEEVAPAASHGFFDEEDDEKIALTGDELDNILNTADFTEEAGSDAVEEDSDSVSLDLDLIGSESTPESIQDSLYESSVDNTPDLELTSKPDLFAEESSIERINLPSEEDESSDTLKQLQEEGVKPMTPPPEDTSYLESEELIIDDLDLSEAVIEEPDLGGVVFEENSVEEPMIDSLDLGEETLHEEALHAESLTAEEPADNLELDDISITLEDDAETEIRPEESFAQVIPENFVVESTDEPLLHPEEEEAIEIIPESEAADVQPALSANEELPPNLRNEVKAVLSYMDQLLESLPEDKIEEFAQSEYFETYKKLFEELGLS